MQTFDLYRYQLLPISQFQQHLFDKPLSADEIRAKKNIFFKMALEQLPQFTSARSQVIHKTVFHLEDWFVLKIGSHKSITRDTEDFHIEKIETWPNITIIINNNSSSQIIAVSRNHKAFNGSRSVINLLSSALTKQLYSFGLSVEIKEIFEKNSFWRMIDEHKNNILKIRFEMIAPNMANISKALTVDLKQLHRDSNCHKANIELEAPHDSHLEVNPDNELINGCVDYSSEGGGDIVLKIKGLRRQLKTSTSIKTLEIDEFSVQNPSADFFNSLTDLLQ